MSKTRKILLVLLGLICALALAWGLASCSTSHVSVTSITLDSTSLELTVGETKEVAVTVSPDNATDAEWSFEVGDSNVVSATPTGSGAIAVKGVKAGSTTIKVISDDDSSVYAELSVTVTAASVPVTSLTPDSSSLSMNTGDTKTINITASPDNATDKTIKSAISSDETVVKVTVNTNNTSITVEAVAAGSATITVTANDGSGVTVTITITVTDNSGSSEPETATVESIAITPATEQSITVGETVSFTATVIMSDGSDYEGEISWASSESGIVSIDNGTVTGIAAGTTYITATAGDKTSNSVAVTVTETADTTPVYTLTVDPTTLDLTVDGEEGTVSVTLTATNNGSTEWNYSITDGEGYISIDKTSNGLTITPVAEGTTTIKVYAVADEDNTYATVTVNVEAAPTPTYELTVNPTTVDLTVGGESKDVAVAVAATYDGSEEWSYEITSGDGFITVDKTSDGLTISPVAEGTAYITVTATGDSTKTETITVNVTTVEVSSITVSQSGADVTTSGASVTEYASITLNVTISPDNASDKDWEATVTAGYEDYVEITAQSVEDGTITVYGLEAGIGNITIASSDGAVSISVPITVVGIPATDIELSTSTVTLTYNDGDNSSATVTVTITPANADVLTWSVAVKDGSESGIVTYTTSGTSGEDITITAVAVGSTTLVVTALGGDDVSAEIAVTVNPVYVDSFSFSGDKLEDGTVTIEDGSYADIEVTFNPTNATSKDLSISGENGIVSVDYDETTGIITITAESIGSTTLTISATDNGGDSYSATLNVTVEPILVTGLTFTGDDLTDSTVTIKDGATTEVSVEFTPSDPTSKELSITSSDDSIATAEYDATTGTITITANGSTGTATLTITAMYNGVAGYSTELTVVVEPILIEDFNVTGGTSVGEYEYLTLYVEIDPSDATDKTWTATATGDITVTDYDCTAGTITVYGASTGSGTITIASTDGNATKTVDITVVGISVDSVKITNTDSEEIDTLTLVLGVDSAETVNVVVDPEDADEASNWSASITSGDGVVTISQDTATNEITITPVSAGTAVITVSVDGQTATLTVTVIEYSISVEPETLDLTVNGDNGTVEVTVSVTPTYDSADTEWTYEITSGSSYISIVSDDDNTLTIEGLATGTATITVTAKADSSKTAEITVNVTNPVQSISLGSDIELTVGDTDTITVTFDPEDADDTGWTQSVSQDGTVISVETNGNTITITAESAGEATLTVTSTADPSVSASVTITVSAIPTEGISVTQDGTAVTELTMTEGDDAVTLDVAVTPDNATDKTWSVSGYSDEVITVSYTDSTITITPVAAGETSITVTANGGDDVYATISITVEAAAPTLDSIGITSDATDYNMTVGDTITLTVTANMSDGSTEDVTSEVEWSSTDNSVASVTDGVLTANGAGTATITATYNGKTDTIDVTVEAKAEPSLSIEGDTDIIITSASSTTLTLVDANGNTISDVSWTSATTDVATVSGSGTTATVTLASTVQFGSTVITATATIDGKTYTATTTVYATAEFFYEAGINQGSGTWQTTDSADYAASAGLILEETDTGVYVWTGDISTDDTPWGFQIYYGNVQDWDVVIGYSYYSAAGSSDSYVSYNGDNFKVTETGVYTITLNLNGGVATVTITLDSIDVASVNLETTGSAVLSYEDNSSVTYTVTVTPDDATATDFTASLSSSYADYASYVEVSTSDSNGMSVTVTCIDEATESFEVTLTVSVSGVTAERTITVQPSGNEETIDHVAFEQSSYTYNVNNGSTAAWTVTVSAAAYKDSTTKATVSGVSYSTTDSNVTVNSSTGVVTATQVGTFTITATSDEDGSVSESVKVTFYSDTFYIAGDMSSWTALGQTTTTISSTFEDWTLTATDSTYTTFSGTFSFTAWQTFQILFLGMPDWNDAITSAYVDDDSAASGYYTEGWETYGNTNMQFSTSGTYTITVDISGDTPVVYITK